MNKIIKQRQDLIEESIDSFNELLPEIQKELWKKILLFIKELDLNKDGTLKANTNNLKLINSFVFKELKKTIKRDEYKDAVNEYLKSFSKAARLTDKYFNNA